MTWASARSLGRTIGSTPLRCATVSKATIGQALLGTVLFHALFIVSPLAGKNIMGSAQVGEYFRVFIAYGVIGIALALHAWQRLVKKA